MQDDDTRALFWQMAPLQDITRATRDRRDALVGMCALLEEGRALGMSKGYLLKLAKWILFSDDGASREEGERELPSVVYEVIAEKFNGTSERREKRELPMCNVYYEDTIIARVLDPYAPDEEAMNAPSSPAIGGHDQIGLRLWPGELFVMEFLHDELFVRNRGAKYFPQPESGVVLELGAGVGLAGFWCLERGGATRLLLTDFNESVLENLRVSTGFYDNTPSSSPRDPTSRRRVARVARLDWQAYLDNAGEAQSEEDPMINDTALVIAADAIYDPNDVDAFLAALVSVMTRTPSCVALVACAERNAATFSLFLERLALVSEKNPNFSKRVSRVCTHKDIPQRYHYRAVHLFDRGDSVRRNEIRLFVIE